MTLSRMWKAIVLFLTVLAAGEPRSYAQVTCPVLLFRGISDQDSIKLSFMNKGKIPIEQLVLTCSPSPDPKTKTGVCHTESGIFYPGTEYSIDISYPGASRRSITVSLQTASLAGGILWKSTPAKACRTLKIQKKK